MDIPIALKFNFDSHNLVLAAQGNSSRHAPFLAACLESLTLADPFANGHWLRTAQCRHAKYKYISLFDVVWSVWALPNNRCFLTWF
jgi:hypothetical protein